MLKQEKRVAWVRDYIRRYGSKVSELGIGYPPAFLLEAGKAVLYLYSRENGKDLFIGDYINRTVFGEEGCTCFSADMYIWAIQARRSGEIMM